MDTEPRRRQLREYLWFALLLLAVLMGSVIQENAGSAIHGQAAAILTVSRAPH
jgi:hypothetical protein